MKKTLKWRLAQTLEKVWWKRYLSDKNPNDYLIWKTQYWKTFFKPYVNLIPIKNSSLIADIGCGPAGIFTIFNLNNLTAVDPLLIQYEKELEVFDKSKYPNTSFVNSSFEEFKTKKQFDVVFCLNAINHVNSLKVSFEKLNEITKSGGYCLLSIDAHNYEILKFIFRALPGDALHPHQYNLKEYTEMFQNAGFEIIDVNLNKPQFIFNYYVLLGRKTI